MQNAVNRRNQEWDRVGLVPPHFGAPGPAMHWSPPTFGPTTDLTNCVNAPLADCQSVSVAAHQPHLYLWPIFLSISMTVHCTSCLLPGTSLYSTEYRRVTDGQTDRQTDRHLAMAESALSIRVAASCSKNASKCTISSKKFSWDGPSPDLTSVGITPPHNRRPLVHPNLKSWLRSCIK